MAKFRIVHLPPGEKSNKNVVRVKVYDLKPKTDPKGGAADEKKDDKRPSGRTGEADFMKGGCCSGSLKSPVCSCVSITFSSFIVNANHSGM